MSWKPALIIVVCLLGHTHAFAQRAKFSLPAGVRPTDYESGQVWVKVKPDYRDVFLNSRSSARIPALVDTHVRPLLSIGSRNKSAGRLAPRKVDIDMSRYFRLSFDKNYPIEDYINKLYATGYFELVEPLYTEQMLFTPNDPAISSQYYLDLINASEAWDISRGSTSVVIGIVDTGVDLNHPDLQKNIYIDPADPTDGIDNDGDGYIDNNRGWDFSGSDASLIGTPGFQGDNNPSVFSGNRFGHGTMVAGCASASTNDAIGISGVGFNTKLLFTKHYADNQPDNSTSYSSNLYEGVLYAALHGAKIINCSWGNPYASGIAQDVIDFVTLELGCLVIAAAGNSNSESPLYPAAYDHVLSVASSDENDARSWFSNYGRTVDIIAPGSNIYTTNYDDGYRTDSGTSLAAPIVAGAAALVWAHSPSLTPLQVAEQLRISADETIYLNSPDYLHKLGRGRLDMSRALTIRSPSIRASNQRLVNNSGDAPGPGETAKLYYDFTNFLIASSSGLTVTLTSSSPFVTITQNRFRPGAMTTNHTVGNEGDPFELTFAANLPVDQPIEAMLTYSDGSYQDSQLVTFVLPSFIDINENNITTTITSAGRIGYSNAQAQSNGSGFIYDDQSILFEMGVIMGTSSSLLFDNVRGASGVYNQDFTSASKIKKLTPGERSNSEVTGSFRNAVAAGAESLQISYRSLVWRDEPYQNFVILEYTVRNTTSSDISKFFMGIFADWDILSGGSSDRAAWDNDTRLGYVFPAQPSGLPRAGIQALSDKPNYYAIDNDQSIAGNPLGIYDGFSDNEKFTAISSGIAKTQAGGTTGDDVSQVVSVGPYDILAGEEITIAFALHGATTLQELISSAKYADTLYNYTFRAAKPTANSVEICQGDDAILRVNGARKFNWYEDFIGGAPIFSGPELTIPSLQHDTVLFVSNAEESYESLRTPISVAVKSKPTIIASGDLEFCEGRTVVLSATKGNEYTWNTGAKTESIEVGISGNYTVQVRDGQVVCPSMPVQVTVNAKPISDFTVSTESMGDGYLANFVNQSVGASSWHWDFGDGQVSNQENPEHNYPTMGNYIITLTSTSEEGCESTEAKPLEVITEIETSLEKSITLYPNPVNAQKILLHRTITDQILDVQLYDSQGKIVYQRTLENSDAENLLNISGLVPGVYQVRISTPFETLYTKIIVAR
jgi:serine protease